MSPDSAGLPSEGSLAQVGCGKVQVGGPPGCTDASGTVFKDEGGESQAGSRHPASGAEREGDQAPLSGTHFQHQLPTLTLLGSQGRVLRPVMGSPPLPAEGPAGGTESGPLRVGRPASRLSFGFGSQDRTQPSILLDTPGLTRRWLLPTRLPKSAPAGMPAPPGTLVFRGRRPWSGWSGCRAPGFTRPLSDLRLGNTQVL